MRLEHEGERGERAHQRERVGRARAEVAARGERPERRRRGPGGERELRREEAVRDVHAITLPAAAAGEPERGEDGEDRRRARRDPGEGRAGRGLRGPAAAQLGGGADGPGAGAGRRDLHLDLHDPAVTVGRRSGRATSRDVGHELDQAVRAGEPRPLDDLAGLAGGAGTSPGERRPVVAHADRVRVAPALHLVRDAVRPRRRGPREGEHGEGEAGARSMAERAAGAGRTPRPC